jgi:predicted AlkP superfamily phosphohydrolase/phosphomutase
MISGLLTPLGSRACTYPPEFMDSVLGVAPDYKVVPTQTYAPGRADAFLDDIEKVIGAKSRVLLDHLRSDDWSFAMQVFNETDFLQHALWHVMDPEHPRHDKDEYARLGDRIYGIYRKIDKVIGEALEIVGEDTSVVILSDHGHGPLHEFIHANNLLIRAGMMNVRRTVASRLKYLLFKAGLTPLNAYRIGNTIGLGRLRMGLRWTRKGYEMLRRFFFSFSDIDWQRTQAYAISGGVYGGLFVNLKGREPAGVVNREEYEDIRDRLETLLKGLAHPRDDGALVSEVIRREEVYGGRFSDEAPDMFFLPRDATIAVFGDFEFSSNKVVEPASEAISAQHRMEGVFIARGKGLNSGTEITGMSVLDIAPLLLYSMGLPIPGWLDGVLRPDVFAEGVLDGSPPAYCNAEEVPGAKAGGRGSTEDESIKDRLKGLGYIS